MASALLSFEDARVDEGGRPVVDGLSFATTATKVLVVGAPRAVFEAGAGMRGARRGKITVAGSEPRDAAGRGLVAGAPLDPPMPPGWSIRKYVEVSAGLVGHGGERQARLVAEALGAVKLDAMAEVLLGKAITHARRATVIAAALATGASTILLEDPLVSLPDDTARGFGRILALALEDRAWIAFVGRAPLGSPLSTYAEEAIVILGSEVVAQGPPAEIAVHDTTYMIRVAGDRDEFAAALEKQGVKVEIKGDAFKVDVGPAATTVLFEVARVTDAVIVELRPIAGGFV